MDPLVHPAQLFVEGAVEQLPPLIIVLRQEEEGGVERQGDAERRQDHENEPMDSSLLLRNA